MLPRGFKLAALAAACALGLAAPSHPAPSKPWTPGRATQVPGAPAESAAAAKRPVRFINDEPDTGQFLPDSVLLARVADREIRVRNYVETYFRSYAEYRPRPDSAGRLVFLNSMIDKDVLGLVALSVNRPLSFEDRATMREHTQRVLSDVLFQRAVLDSVTVSEEDVRRAYDEFRYELHLRHIQLADRATAERVRRDLMAGRIAWKQAVRTYSTAPDSDRARDGDLGWHKRAGFDPNLAAQVFTLGPSGFSPILQDPMGYQLIQVLERRADDPPGFEAFESLLRTEVRNRKIAIRAAVLRDLLRNEISMVYDSTNVDWASSRFSPARTTTREGRGTTMEFNTGMPEFSPSDTGRVLARHRHGQFTLGSFLESYQAAHPLTRPNVTDFESLLSFMDGIVLEPYMAELATRRGLDRDSLAIQQIQSRREEILVEHLYQDSVMSKVWVRPEDRRKYYQDHLSGYDSLAARLRAGEKAADLLRADSLEGRTTGTIQERSANDRGTPYYKLLFEELRPGKVSVEGPDRVGDYAVIQLLSFDSGHQLAFEEVESIVDESVQNLHAEERLKEFLARYRKRFRIVAHPELLSRVRMADASLAE
jgi:parvulin-like peptidyl-prolyl isomerase